uniref:Putative membrane protein n=1 Tax=uncultured Armatimonadetes bacterium TaxID=157466 RepID=A0A6J4H4U9_9BACT|nr:putative membrane protein [uncultured Armatimonadetes bacterium]
MTTIPLHSLMRLGAVGVAVLLAAATGGKTPWLEIAFSLGFGHYLLSLLYAKKQIARVVREPQTLAACAVLVAGAGALYVNGFSLVIYFGVHHVFNEVYLLGRAVRLDDGADARRLRLWSILLNFFIYFGLLRHHAELGFVPRETLVNVLLAGLAVGYPAFFFYLLRLRRSLTTAQLVDLCTFEVLGFLLLVVSCFVNIWFVQIVFYHFVFWALFPLPRMAAQGRGPALTYVALNVAATAFFLLLSPLALLPVHLSAGQWDAQFRFWSYLHITLSFALSTAHPAWITRWFQSRPAAPPVAAASGTGRAPV